MKKGKIKRLNKAMYWLVCPDCGKKHHSAPEKELLPDLLWCDCLKNKTHSKSVLRDVFSVLDVLGGDISGDYKKDRKRTPQVEYSEELYNLAYQLSEQP